MQNMLINMLLGKLQAQNPQQANQIRQMMSSNTNPQDILKTLSLSFEVFPPKKWEDFPGLYETLDELKGLHPEFISCTYGAGGSNSKKTAEIHSGSSRTVNLEIAKDGIYHPLEV